MLIVIEGHDLSGKTTLVRDLGSRFGVLAFAPWADLSASRPSLTSVSRTLLRLVNAHSQPVIVDRFITSELVYGRLAERPVAYVLELLDEWKEVGLIVWQLEISEAELVQRHNFRGDDAHSLEELKQIRREYLDLHTMLPDWIPFSKGDPAGIDSILLAALVETS